MRGTQDETDVNLFLECQNTFGVQTNNRKILHFQFINRKRRNFTVIIHGIVRLLVV